MSIEIQYDTKDIDWQEVPNLLRGVEMGYHTPEIHQRAFEKSHTVVFVKDDGRLVGFGRAISDGEYQAAIYDVAVSPDCQGRGIGKMIVEAIVSRLPGCNFMLYASPGKELFYEKSGFRKMKTGMARFVDMERMKAKGFVE